MAVPPLKTAAGLRIGKLVGEKLDRDPAPKPGVEGEPDSAHAALPQLRLDAVLPYLQPRGKLHSRRDRRVRISVRDHRTATTLKVELIEIPAGLGDRRYRLRVNNGTPRHVQVATLTEVFARLRRWLVRRA